MSEKKTTYWSWQAKLLIAILLMGGGCVALIVPATMNAREAARRSSDKANFKQTGWSVHDFNDRNQTLPREEIDSEILQLSWQSQILPTYMPELFEQIQRGISWDSETNRVAYSTYVSLYVSNSCPIQDRKNEHGYALTTLSLNRELLNDRTSFSINDITDGASNTLLIGEIRENLPPWGKPGNFRDLTLGINKSPHTFGGYYRGGIIITTVDTQVRFLSEKTDSKVLEALATPDSGDDPGEF